jgi:hypothetical protein
MVNHHDSDDNTMFMICVDTADLDTGDEGQRAGIGIDQTIMVIDSHLIRLGTAHGSSTSFLNQLSDCQSADGRDTTDETRRTLGGELSSSAITRRPVGVMKWHQLGVV